MRAGEDQATLPSAEKGKGKPCFDARRDDSLTAPLLTYGGGGKKGRGLEIAWIEVDPDARGTPTSAIRCSLVEDAVVVRRRAIEGQLDRL